MKFTLDWLREHLETTAAVDEIVEAMTRVGMEVEHVLDPAAKLAAFSVAKIVDAVQHPNADRLRVCQVETIDGMKEIVCGAPNARAGLTTIYAPIGTFIPGSGITLEPRAVRGVVSNGMLCSAAELETAAESDGILELAGDLAIGATAAEALGLDSVIDFEVTPNRADWLGVNGVARDLAAAGLGALIDSPVEPVAGSFPCPIEIRLTAPEACPAFAGRLVRGVKNGPSPAWLQARLKAIGLRPISALVDITNLLGVDRARPLHVYDVAKLSGGFIEARLGREGEQLDALDGKTYAVGDAMCVIADASGAIGLGGVMGGTSTGCSFETTDVFIESAWFDPLRTAQTGRDTGIVSDAQYRFARGVDPESLVPGLERATRLVLDLCGGEASEVVFAGQAPARLAPIVFDPSYVQRLSGIDVPADRVAAILTALGFDVKAGFVQPPSWRRDIDGKADLVEEVARIEGFDALPSTPLPELPRAVGGVLTVRQGRIRLARRAMAAAGYQEAVTWSFTSRKVAALFGGGSERLVLDNPMAPDLDCMRPSALPGLIQAVGRNARRGFPGAALFEIGPIFAGDEPGDQRTVIAAVLQPSAARTWKAAADEDVYALKADLLALLRDLGAPATMAVDQAQPAAWWRPGRSASLRLGKNVLATFGELHPATLTAMDVEGPILAFEIVLDLIPEPKRGKAKTKPALKLSPLMPLTRDFAFVVDKGVAGGDLERALVGADRQLVDSARVFDVYSGPGVPEGKLSLTVEVVIQPRDATLGDAEIQALSRKLVAAAEKATGATLRR
jgi:phenylalanyl-tRNA synthetase beta chain